MAEKKDKSDKPEAAPGEPGSEEWERSQKILAGEVEPGTGDLPEPVDRGEPDEEK